MGKLRTMSFKPIIQAAGDDPSKYSRTSHFRIKLYDANDNIISDENIRFDKPLFEESSELERFKNLLQRLENIIPTFFIDIQINENAVIVFYNTPEAEIFLRHTS